MRFKSVLLWELEIFLFLQCILLKKRTSHTSTKFQLMDWSSQAVCGHMQMCQRQRRCDVSLCRWCWLRKYLNYFKQDAARMKVGFSVHLQREASLLCYSSQQVGLKYGWLLIILAAILKCYNATPSKKALMDGWMNMCLLYDLDPCHPPQQTHTAGRHFYDPKISLQ